MVMFYHRIIIIIFCSYIFGYLPSEPSLSNYTNQSRIDIQGWPSLGIIDLGEGLEETIIAGTGGGLGRIINTSLLGSIEDNIYEISSDDLPLGANPAMKTYIVNDELMIIVSGVTSEFTGGENRAKGTGISWSIDNGESWRFMPQSVEPKESSPYIDLEWGGQILDQLSVTTEINNVS